MWADPEKMMQRKPIKKPKKKKTRKNQVKNVLN